MIGIGIHLQLSIVNYLCLRHLLKRFLFSDETRQVASIKVAFESLPYTGWPWNSLVEGDDG